jgi:hypothetical protein
MSVRCTLSLADALYRRAAMGFSTYDAKQVLTTLATDGDTYTPDALFALSAPDARVHGLAALTAMNTDIAPIIIDVHQIVAGPSDNGVLFSVTIPAGAGNGTVPLCNVLAEAVVAPYGSILAEPDSGFGYSYRSAPSAATVVNLFALILIF